jgi:glucose-1-phosphate adenylyltransferase
MDFLTRKVRHHFLVDYPHIYTKASDLPPVKYNQGCEVNNSIISCGSIINGRVDNSLIFKNVFIGENSIIKNSIILNDVYIGNNAYVENCIVESKGTVLQGSYYRGEDEIKIVTDDNNRYEIY